MRHILHTALLLLTAVLVSCTSSRHVPKGGLLLDNVSMTVDEPDGTFDTQELMSYLRQLPNHKMLWSIKFRLGIYNMSGADSTKWWNRWARNLGEPPVVYDSMLMESGKEQLLKAMANKGYLNSNVTTLTTVDTLKRKIRVEYRLHPGKPHIINTLGFNFPDKEIETLVMRDTSHFNIKPGVTLDMSLLEKQREVIIQTLRDNGYYGFAKENISFTADTTAGSESVDLLLTIKAPQQSGKTAPTTYKKYIFGKIYYVTDYNPADDTSLRNLEVKDTVNYKGITILYGDKRYLRPGALYESCYMFPGQEFRQRDADRTYQALSRYSILKFINIRFIEAGQADGYQLLDTYVLLTPGKSQGASVELEGTNSEGDLGVAAGVTYTHRNIGRGSETLTVKLRGAYESLSGNLDGLIHDRYMEYSGEASINFPKFKAPLLSERFKRRVNATTELNAAMTYQERPEYTRIISTAGWSYKWTHNRNHNRYIFTPIDVNYVYLPESTYNFINEIAPDNPLLRYSYEDHFIMRMGFTFYHSNKRGEGGAGQTLFQRNVHTIRANTEFAGNVLYLASCLFMDRPDAESPYKIFGIPYSQYFKINADYSLLHTIDSRNSLAFHAGFGIGYPYGNSTILPFEKRFYEGGANGVRGWDVRTLGPGRFPGTNSVSDFINQCGDIRIDLSAEYRAKLFWVIELGAFIDAGNIWTIHNYPNQPGGMFHFNSFYKEIAAAYGLGVRLDFNYFLLRLDLGMKAYNPAMGQEKWPLIHPDWKRDKSLHFSIGYPF